MILRERSDTIAAVATGEVTAALSVIRVSGPRSFEILPRLFRRPRGASVAVRRSRELWFGRIVDEGGRPLDEVMLSALRGPGTFTGEDGIEISCHGGVVCRRRILERLFELGVRPAEAGEFSLRAFLNGKMSLGQAEALDGLVHARCDGDADEELFQMQGVLDRRIRGIRSRLLEIVARIEVLIDFPEEDVPEEGLEESRGRVRTLVEEIRLLGESHRWGRMLREGIRCTLVGRPNVGKSSLLNALLQRDRALVSPTPGTTRDVIEEGFRAGGLSFLLRDTAGLRETGDEIETRGTELARRARDGSDLVLLVVEAHRDGPDEDELRWIDELPRDRLVLVANKADLGSSFVVDGTDTLFVSAETGIGVPVLVDEIVRRGRGLETRGPEGGVILRLRHHRRLGRAVEALEAYLDASCHLPPDVATTHLYEGADELGAITGEILREEVLEEIFGRFCIGK